MNKLRSILVANRYFFIGYLLLFLTGLGFLLAAGKEATFLYLNPWHRSTLDALFTNLTYLGDGLFAVAVIIVLILLRKSPEALQLLTAFILSALLAQVFKSYFSMPRPREFFNHGQYEGPYTNFIQGVTLRGFSSFPSGHSTSIFTLATMLAMFARNKVLSLLYLAGAFAVGYSRIYLGQHFLPDVLFGSALGVGSAILVHWLFSQRFQDWVEARKVAKSARPARK